MELEPDYTYISLELFEGEDAPLDFKSMATMLFMYIATNADNDGVFETSPSRLSEVMKRDSLQIMAWLREMKQKGIITLVTGRGYVKITIKPGLTFHGFRED